MSTARHGSSSSFRSESEAFEDALAWIIQNTTPHDKVAILTDSLSLVSKVESGMVKKPWLEYFKKIKAIVILAYIPSHCGIPVNERADQLARNAVPIGELRRYNGNSEGTNCTTRNQQAVRIFVNVKSEGNKQKVWGQNEVRIQGKTALPVQPTGVGRLDGGKP